MAEMIQGMRITKNINQDRRVVDMSKKIALLKPEKAPLTVILKRMGTRPASNAIFHWLEDNLQARWSKVASTTESTPGTEVTVPVGDGGLFAADDVVKIPRTNEIMRVISVANDKLTVTRGFGETQAVNLEQGDDLLIIGNARIEGGLGAEPSSTITATRYNYTQIFKTSVQVSKTQEATELYGGGDRAYQRSKKGIEHMEDLERAFIFGEKSEHYGTNEVVRTAGGVLSFMTGSPTLEVATPDGFTQGALDEFLEDVFRYGSQKKTLFASSRLITRINEWALGKLQVEIGEKTFGLATTTYVSPHGILNIVKHPLFEGPYNGMGLILDLENVKYRPLKGRDTKLETNIQPNDADYYKDQYLTEAGIELKLPQTHALIKGVE